MELPREAPRKEHERVMDKNGTTPESSKMRHGRAGLPYNAVGAALLGVVLVLLGAAFFLNSRLRPPTTIETPIAVQAPRPAVATPSAIPTAAAASVSPSLTATPSIGSPTAESTAQLPPGVHVANTPEEREIEQAYLKYWQVYSDAVLNLDTSHLHEVLAGPALQWVTDEVNGLKAQGHPAKIDVQHAYGFSRVTETSATVVDQYVSRSVYLDPTTRQPLPRAGSPTRVLQSFDFQKINGVWKIVGGTRQDLGEAGS